MERVKSPNLHLLSIILKMLFLINECWLKLWVILLVSVSELTAKAATNADLY